MPLDTLGAVLESMGFAPAAPDEPMREDELEVSRCCSSAGPGPSTWPGWTGSAGRDGLRLLPRPGPRPTRRVSRGRRWSPGRPGDRHGARRPARRRLLPLGDPALLGIYRRQQELSWTSVSSRASRTARGGRHARTARAGPGECYLDLTGSAHLTEQQGDTTAAALAGPWPSGQTVLASAPGRAHQVARRRGDHPPPGAGRGVLSALGLVAQLPEAASRGPCRGGARAGVAQGDDDFGRTVNLAARIAATRPRARSSSASAWPSRPHPRACASWSRGNYHSRGSPNRCGCWRPAGRDV